MSQLVATRSGNLTLGVVGYGRFGKAISDLISQTGYKVAVFDPHSDTVPPDISCNTLHSLIERSKTIIFAIPVSALETSLQSCRPALTSDHLIMDVGSVKVQTTQIMSSVLSDAIPWVATHPLFGPASIAAGEKPFRVVICPETPHQHAYDYANQFYQSLGCSVIKQTAEYHDKRMARTHALVFFIAKAMVEMGEDGNAADAPPSFKALTRAIEAVRADAGHLFTAIQNENPFSGESRKELINTLTTIDNALIAGTRDIDI